MFKSENNPKIHSLKNRLIHKDVSPKPAPFRENRQVEGGLRTL